jgi:hypothetical protein
MMEAVSTYETSVNVYQTTQPNIPEDNYLQLIYISSRFRDLKFAMIRVDHGHVLRLV